MPQKPFQMKGPDECTEVKFGDQTVLLVCGSEFTFDDEQLTDEQHELYIKALKAAGLKAPQSRKPKGNSKTEK